MWSAAARSSLTCLHGAWRSNHSLPKRARPSASRRAGAQVHARRAGLRPPRRAAAMRSATSGSVVCSGTVPSNDALQERQRAVHQVAPGRHQLVVVAADEVLFGVVGVGRLGRVGDQVVADRRRGRTPPAAAGTVAPTPALLDAFWPPKFMYSLAGTSYGRITSPRPSRIAGQITVWNGMLSLPMK